MWYPVKGEGFIRSEEKPEHTQGVGEKKEPVFLLKLMHTTIITQDYDIRARTECRVGSLAVSMLISPPLFYCDGHSTMIVLKVAFAFLFFLFFYIILPSSKIIFKSKFA